MITAVTVRRNRAGAGWFVLVTDDVDGIERAVGGSFQPHMPIIDMALVQAEVAKQTMALLLERSLEP